MTAHGATTTNPTTLNNRLESLRRYSGHDYLEPSDYFEALTEGALDTIADTPMATWTSRQGLLAATIAQAYAVEGLREQLATAAERLGDRVDEQLSDATENLTDRAGEVCAEGAGLTVEVSVVADALQRLVWLNESRTTRTRAHLGRAARTVAQRAAPLRTRVVRSVVHACRETGRGARSTGLTVASAPRRRREGGRR